MLGEPRHQRWWQFRRPRKEPKSKHRTGPKGCLHFLRQLCIKIVRLSRYPMAEGSASSAWQKPGNVWFSFTSPGLRGVLHSVLAYFHLQGIFWGGFESAAPRASRMLMLVVLAPRAEANLLFVKDTGHSCSPWWYNCKAQ